MDLLDKAVGIDGWSDSYRRDSNGGLICRLELNIGNGGWIGKEDTGTESDKTKVRTYRQIDGRVWIPTELLRPANKNEITAGWREGSKEYDQYWYGQSEEEAIKEHNVWQSELIEGGAMFVGDNSKIVQMVKDFDVEEQSQ